MKTKIISIETFLNSESIDYFNQGNFEFPFEVTPSFRMLTDYLKKESESNNNLKSGIALSLLKETEKHPELISEIRDWNLIKKHEQLIENIMMFVFPEFFRDKQAFAASTPFTDKIIYASPGFKSKFMEKGVVKSSNLNISPELYFFGKTIGAFGLILEKYYGLEYKFGFPIVHKVMNPDNGLDMYFKMNMANEFVNIENKGKLNKFSESELDEIKDRIYDINFLIKKINPKNFRFSGFLAVNMINISDTEIISSIGKELIQKDSITTYSGFLKLQHHLKSLINCPDILLGIVDVPSGDNDYLDLGHRFGNNICFKEFSCNCMVCVRESIYEKVIKDRKILIIEDLKKYKEITPVEEKLLRNNVRNIFLAPLVEDNMVIGILEIISSIPGRLNQINTLKMYEVLPLFALALSRSKMETLNKIHAVIKEKCTAIHPSLEWRFKEAARNLLSNEVHGKKSEMEEITFSEVYPLYGLSDIRNSSVHRNNSIREDLIYNLELAKEVIGSAYELKEMEALSELLYRIDKKINSLKFTINSGDESEVIKFLSKHIVPLFDNLSGFGEKVKAAIDKYRSEADRELGFVYKKRKNFEESASAINSMIAKFLDSEQVKIQEVFPHYFERYKTDGVEHNIYVGQSMVKNGKFDKIFLKNLRLWQLVMICKVAMKSKKLMRELTVPLGTAHLILVQDSPLTIRFRFDEKKFDVDGAYNIRYEILKKRIDKAEIKGREERLTQPGKIAIVYNQISEITEYYEYIEYLNSRKFLEREVEELELEEMQGIKGLKALRVKVNMNSSGATESISSDSILKEFTSMKSK